MGKILDFSRPDRHADMEKLLRGFYAEELELGREVDPEIVLSPNYSSPSPAGLDRSG